MDIFPVRLAAFKQLKNQYHFIRNKSQIKNIKPHQTFLYKDSLRLQGLCEIAVAVTAWSQGAATTTLHTRGTTLAPWRVTATWTSRKCSNSKVSIATVLIRHFLLYIFKNFLKFELFCNFMYFSFALTDYKWTVRVEILFFIHFNCAFYVKSKEVHYRWA